MVLLFHTTYISVDLAHHKTFRAKVGKGGIMRVYVPVNSYGHVETVSLPNQA